MTTPLNVAELAIKMLRKKIFNDTSIIEDFKHKLNEDHHKALTWGNGVFAASARIQMNTSCIGILERSCKENTPERAIVLLKEALVNRLTMLAVDVHNQSTGITNTIMNRCEVAAIAQILNDFELEGW